MDHLDRVREEFTRQAIPSPFTRSRRTKRWRCASGMLSAMQGTAASWTWRVARGGDSGTRATCCKITAFDATPAMLEKARAHCEEAGLENIIFREGNA